MESRSGLIERAAALLRETGQETPPAPTVPKPGEIRSAPSEARPPLGAPVAPLRQSVVPVLYHWL